MNHWPGYHPMIIVSLHEMFRALKYQFILKIVFLFSSLCLPEPLVVAQTDSLFFVGGGVLVGEIKSMDRGVLTIETSYSDDDFKVEWEKVVRINTETQLLITLSDNENVFLGTLQSVGQDTIEIVTYDGMVFESTLQQVVYLEPIEERFIDRVSAQIDLGLDLAKAKNLKSVTSRLGIGYKTELWATNVLFNTLRSAQDGTDLIQRIEGEANLRYILPRLWYAIATYSLLSNTEQKLDLRSNVQMGFGRFMLRTNSAYWGAKLGVNRNIERYSNETEDRNSWEGYVGTELNLYDIGDFSMLFSVIAYPGITAKGRWRSDASLDIKYDLPYDFYIRLGTSVNYDNRPAEDASELDYVIQSGFGWEW
jgi:hypothetical protein